MYSVSATHLIRSNKKVSKHAHIFLFCKTSFSNHHHFFVCMCTLRPGVHLLVFRVSKDTSFYKEFAYCSYMNRMNVDGLHTN